MSRKMPFLFLLLPILFFLTLVWKTPLSPSGDLWGLLATGKMATKTLLQNHAWLTCRVLALCEIWGGDQLLRMLNFALIFVVFGCIGRYVFDRTHNWLFVGFVLSLCLPIHSQVYDTGQLLFEGALLCILLLGPFARVHVLSKKELLVILSLSVIWVNIGAKPYLLILIFLLNFTFLAVRQGRRVWTHLALQVLATGIHPCGWDPSLRSLRMPPWSMVRFPFIISDGNLLIEASFPNFVLLLILAWVTWSAVRLIPLKGEKVEHGYRLLICVFATLLSVVFPRNGIYLIVPLTIAAVDTWNVLRMKFAFPIRPRLATIGGLTAILGVLWGSDCYRSREVTTQPKQAIRFLKEVGITGSVLSPQEWSGYLAYHQFPLSRVTPQESGSENPTFAGVLEKHQETDILIWKSMVAVREMLGKKWFYVFDNNLVTIAIRNNARNRNNLERVKKYYASQKISFLSSKSFRLRDGYTISPTWVKEFEETDDLGAWPSSWVQAKIALRDADFYLSRHLGPLAVDRLREAINNDPEEPHLAVRLGEVLIQTQRVAEARRWLAFLDTSPIPKKELAPLRLALFLWEEAQKSSLSPRFP